MRQGRYRHGEARSFAFSEELTVRRSSLSACTQAVLAAEIWHLGLAHDYRDEAALMALEDLEHNTGDGPHVTRPRQPRGREPLQRR